MWALEQNEHAQDDLWVWHPHHLLLTEVWHSISDNLQNLGSYIVWPPGSYNPNYFYENCLEVPVIYLFNLKESAFSFWYHIKWVRVIEWRQASM